jgi:hypothetical protein
LLRNVTAGILWTRLWIFGFCIRLGISSLAEWLSASEGAICSIELVKVCLHGPSHRKHLLTYYIWTKRTANCLKWKRTTGTIRYSDDREEEGRQQVGNDKTKRRKDERDTKTEGMNTSDTRSEISTTVKFEVEVFWVVTPCRTLLPPSSGWSALGFSPVCYSLFTLKMEAARSPKRWHPITTLYGVTTQKTSVHLCFRCLTHKKKKQGHIAATAAWLHEPTDSPHTGHDKFLQWRSAWLSFNYLLLYPEIDGHAHQYSAFTRVTARAW